MALGRMKELFGIAHVRDDEEEVPNAKHMHVVEEDVPVPAAPLVTVLPKGRGCLVPIPTTVSSSPLFFFLKNAGDSSFLFFS
jgi:hypothetical protein